MKMHSEKKEPMKTEMGESDKMESMEEKEIPDHEIESAAHDLLRAEKHKSNHKLMKKVHDHLSSKKKAIESIQDLKDMRNKMHKE
jgi:hypothetical protein